MTTISRVIAFLSPPQPAQQAKLAHAQRQTREMHKRVDELGSRSRQLADWWEDDARRNHYAERIREAFVAEITGSQQKIEKEK